MDFGLGTARSALTSQTQGLSVWANDLANAQTPGFVASVPSFGEALRTVTAQGTWAQTALGGQGRTLSQGVGVTLAGTLPDGADTATVTGTGRALDVALQGPGYLVVEAPGGGRLLTRDGALQVDAAGNLLDAQGDHVLSAALTPIQVKPGSTVTIADGQVQANGQVVATLAVGLVPNVAGLLPESGGRYAVTPASGALTVGPAKPGQIITGFLDNSSLSLSQMFTGLMETENGYELAAKVVSQAQTLASLAAQIPSA